MHTESQFIDMPQPLGLFAGDLYARGLEYLEAFKMLAARNDGKLQFASYFLFAHSLELLLKSFLAANGVEKSVIRYTLGHNLPEIMRVCNLNSISHVENLESFVAHTYEMNKDFDFRYPSRYRLSMPRPDDCAQIADALVAAIHSTVSQAAVGAQLQFASDTRVHRGKKIRWSD
jgi:hypothetical protein